eukprot:m.341552 g.341552  ORF g.341552 m.341552 type:complete len:60 (-) comp155225_c0_seq1:103-282(-)
MEALRASGDGLGGAQLSEYDRTRNRLRRSMVGDAGGGGGGVQAGLLPVPVLQQASVRAR